jgi:DNA-binding NtrC family response regulator
VSRVTVVEGRDLGRVFTLDPSAPSRILLGTSPACELRLTDPTISRRHCAFEVVGQRCKVTDLGSRNGTYIDGVAIVEAFVRGDEILRVGGTALRIENEIDVETEAAPISDATRFGRVLGASLAMRRLYPTCERLSKSRVPVVIEGETGTGKEILAESIHDAGSGGPFVVFDCTMASSTLIESQLFGHERGAFTGAHTAHPGVFEEADGGTLLIDEIGDLDLQLQAKLLRVIDRGEVRRLGGRKSLVVNVRILAATRRDLDKAVSEGRFRDDLYHRLAVARIELPPLRERHGDVTLLAQHFAAELAAPPDLLSADVLARLADHSWPGNVRELRNALARLVALGDLSLRSPEPDSVDEGEGDWLCSILATHPIFSVARRKVLDEFERRYIKHALEVSQGNMTRAARAAGLAPRYFRLVRARRGE